VRRPHRRAGDAGGLADARGRHDVRLDRRLEPIDGPLALDPAHRLQHGGLVGHVADRLVVREPVLEIVVERFLRALTDRGDGRADLGERLDEQLLVAGKSRLDEYDVHGQPSWVRRRYSSS
jgi:hypothetical protein